LFKSFHLATINYLQNLDKVITTFIGETFTTRNISELVERHREELIKLFIDRFFNGGLMYSNQKLTVNNESSERAQKMARLQLSQLITLLGPLGSAEGDFYRFRPDFILPMLAKRYMVRVRVSFRFRVRVTVGFGFGLRFGVGLRSGFG
jgi:hypothetical protein